MDRLNLRTYMLDGMGHAGHAVLIAVVVDVDVEGGARLVRRGIMDQ